MDSYNHIKSFNSENIIYIKLQQFFLECTCILIKNEGDEVYNLGIYRDVRETLT